MEVDRKSCRRCRTEKPIDDFYVHLAMSDGHLNICKECVKIGVRANRERNIDYYRQWDVERHQRPERKAYSQAMSKRHRELNPVKAKARVAVGNAIRDGKLVRGQCEVCGKENAHAHHDDYSKPLDVRWFCVRHHHEYHKQHPELRD